jgi:dTDP-4-amino-4,6-dideoxygalactose transaminase
VKNPEALADAWPHLQSALNHRSRNAAQYEDALANGPWHLLSAWQQSGVCWRYSLLVDFPEKLVAFSEAVRRDGFHASNLYWPVNEFFRPEDRCPVAEHFARRVVNLWVDESVDLDWVQRCSKSLHKNAAQYTS